MKTPHKHAELIKAWADGAEIEVMTDDRSWRLMLSPRWESKEYRIKPEPKPDIVEYRYAERQYLVPVEEAVANLKLTFDGETGKLKSAEVL